MNLYASGTLPIFAHTRQALRRNLHTMQLYHIANIGRKNGTSIEHMDIFFTLHKYGLHLKVDYIWTEILKPNAILFLYLE